MPILLHLIFSIQGKQKIIEKKAEETDELIAEITENPEKNKVIHEAARFMVSRHGIID